MTKMILKSSVGKDAFVKALKHGMELYWDDSSPKKRFDVREGQSNFTRFVNARIEGKLAEVAFSKILKDKYGVESQVDWRIYGDHTITDNGDMQYIVDEEGNKLEPQTEFDIKKTKPWSKWLLVKEFNFKKHDEEAPFILAKMNLEEDISVDEYEGSNSWDEIKDDMVLNKRINNYSKRNLPVTVSFIGTAYKSEFTDHFDKGDYLYSPDRSKKLDELRSNNAGIPVESLVSSKERWNNVMEEKVIPFSV